MIVYKPLWLYGKKDVLEFDTEDAKLIKTFGRGNSVIYRGMVFSGDDLFTSKEGAIYDWDKEYTKSYPYRIKADDPAIKWKIYSIVGSDNT